MKKFLFIILCVFVFNQIDAQSRYFNERYTYTQAHIYPVLINPAASGTSDFHRVLFNYRNKWASFPESPKTISLSYDGKIADRLGFGALLLSDSYGELETTKGQVSFAYSIQSPSNSISFGLSTEFIQHRVAGSAVANAILQANDEVLLSRLDGNTYFDASFGIYGLYNDKISYGLVLPGLVGSSLDDDNGSPSLNEFGFIFNFGYKLESEQNDIVAEPSIFVKQLMGVPTFIDLNMRLGFLEEKLTGGLTYTLGADKRVGFLVGAQINSLNFLYSYNISRNDFQEYNNGSHVITLAFNISGYKGKDSVMDKDGM